MTESRFSSMVRVGAPGRKVHPMLTVVPDSCPGHDDARAVAPSLIDEIVREGARRLLAEALHAKVDDYPCEHWVHLRTINPSRPSPRSATARRSPTAPARGRPGWPWPSSSSKRRKPAGAPSTHPTLSPWSAPERPSPAENSSNELATWRPDMPGADRGGRTPLHYAALADDTAAIRALLSQGADLDAADQLGRGHGERPDGEGQARGPARSTRGEPWPLSEG